MNPARYRNHRVLVRQLANKPDSGAVVFDVDGTLANVESIRHHVVSRPKDFHRFHTESIDVPPHEWVAQAIRDVHHNSPYHALVVTARSEDYAPHTIQWLAENNIPYTDIFFRRTGDMRPDYEVKRDILTKQIMPLYGKPRHAFDDNPAILRMWEEFGIPTTVVPGWIMDRRP